MTTTTTRETKGKTMTKAQAISFLILSLVADGANIKDAIDEVCGLGLYDQMVDELYNKLRS